MKNLCKLFLFILMMTMLVLMQASCVGSTKKLGEMQVINALTYYDGRSESIVQEYVAKINETVLKQKDIELKYETLGGAYGKTLEVAIATDQAPELFSASVSTFAQKKQIRAIEDLPGGKELMKMYPESVDASDLITIPGEKKAKIYSLIVELKPGGIVYNKDLFKKAGIVDKSGNAKPPETWAEVREYAKKLTKPNNQEYGIILALESSNYISRELITPFMTSLYQGVYDVKTGKYDYSVYKPILEWWLGIKEDKSFYINSVKTRFSEGKIGMIFATSDNVNEFNEFAQCDWGVAPYPVLDKNAPRYMQSVFTDSFLSASNMAKEDKYPAIVECMKLLYSVEMQQLLYERGINIPVAKAAIENAKNVSTKKGWKEFGDMSKISNKNKKTFESPVIKLEGNIENATYMKAWNGVITIDEALDDLTKRYNEAYKKEDTRSAFDKSLSTIMNYFPINRPTQPPLPDSLQVK